MRRDLKTGSAMYRVKGTNWLPQLAKNTGSEGEALGNAALRYANCVKRQTDELAWRGKLNVKTRSWHCMVLVASNLMQRPDSEKVQFLQARCLIVENCWLRLVGIKLARRAKVSHNVRNKQRIVEPQAVLPIKQERIFGEMGNF